MVMDTLGFSSGLKISCEVVLKSSSLRNGLWATSDAFAVSVLHGKVSGVYGRFWLITPRDSSILINKPFIVVRPLL